MAIEQFLQSLNENKAVYVVIGATAHKIPEKIGKSEVFFPSPEDMIRMKKAAGRAKDREDLKFLRRLLKAKSRAG